MTAIVLLSALTIAWVSLVVITFKFSKNHKPSTGEIVKLSLMGLCVITAWVLFVIIFMNK